MKNPLNKRLFRELKSDLGKYLVIFVVMVLIIAEGSGFLVAANSMLTAYEESFEKYNVEDGNFRISEKLSKSVVKAIEENEKVPVKTYENFFIEDSMDNKSTLRIFKVRTEVNKASIIKGVLPEKKDEIAIDRMYADNNKLDVGDSLKGKQGEYTVTGLIALSDYSALFQNNGDIMFDAKDFGVAVVPEEKFNEFPKNMLRFSYSWKYENTPKDEAEEKDVSEDLMKEISSYVMMEDYVPRYMNQAINFTGEDFGGDAVMIRVFIYLIIAILAFVFGIIINNTIHNEAENIGTLRASGYTRGELIFHYMTTPVFVTLLSALVGNILGYTVFEKINSDLYYGSYSLPKYNKLFTSEAFIETTLVPILLMVIISYVSLYTKLKISPLNFLRHELNKKGRKRAFYLSRKIPFFLRFRIRVIFQNISNYLVLFFGLFVANFMLIFGMGFPAILDDYQKNVRDNMLSEYQYILQVPMDVLGADSKVTQMLAAMEFANAVETEVESAEKFTAYSLDMNKKGFRNEEISFYGVEENSKYVDCKPEKDDVILSQAFAEKFKIKVGDEISLKEKYNEKEYKFKVTGISDYFGSLCIFMTQDKLNETFDLGDTYFSGYFSDEPITDIDSKYISTVIDMESMTKVSRQLKISMGGFMNVIQYISMIIFMVLVYLLSKIIIEKNAQSISMTKILGYYDSEISNLYINATTIMALISIVVTSLMCSELIVDIFKIMIRSEMNGWFKINITPNMIIRMIVMGTVSYSIIAIFEFTRVKKIPLEEALKNDNG